ncbi:MAG: hydantoinase B/oxoprolinase family protein [Alphaproteobacteria bacterium]|nr:hydantoinase B/oxoprolinase family protein [Alphaproteobacteria bacterium]
MTSSDKWQFWIDRGGTFTDVVARAPGGAVTASKLLSDDPDHYDDAVIEGIRRALGLEPGAPIPGAEIAAIKMGTTVATNALLERKGEPVVLVTTEGFADALRIAYQNRPDLFALDIVLPDLLHSRVIEVPGRVTADGTEIEGLDAHAARAGLEAAFADGWRAAAIVFMHAWRFPDHERAVAEIARVVGFTQVSLSHQVSPLMRLVGRGDTTVADAYLSPILATYVARMQAAMAGVPEAPLGEVPEAPLGGVPEAPLGEMPEAPLGEMPEAPRDGARLLFMQSNGGLTEADRFQGRDAILSGPAGGIVGAVKCAALAGMERIITFDMGGTSTDVAHFDGEYERSFETQIAGVRIRAPMLSIHTVAAGGGSILHFSDGRFQVGPDSAGADPGPACYRKGGPLTVTDANLLLGRLRPEFFPTVFGPGADEPLDIKATEAAFAALGAEISAETGETMSAHQVAQGFLRIAVENMSSAIKKISTQRGRDVTRYGLVSFGGAGGQHACQVADALGMTEIFIHPLGGVLSALGMGLADLHELRSAAVEAEFNAAVVDDLAARLDDLACQAEAALGEQGVADSDVTVLRRAHLRYSGTDTALQVPFGSFEDTLAGFNAAHELRFGFIMNDVPLIAEAVSVEAIGASGIEAAAIMPAPARDGGLAPEGHARIVFDGAARDVDIFRRANLAPGDAINGPAVIVEDGATTLIEPGWCATVSAHDHLVLKRVEPRVAAFAAGTRADPVMLEVFNNLFMSIAEEMGAVLANTAHSVNIKERLDFSCAVFDPNGGLIANAPHMPVHLGSMGDAVRAVMRCRGIDRDGAAHDQAHGGESPEDVAPGMKPGDVFIHNAPYDGGTHLPDITVIRPVFGADGATRLFFVAARGHQADIGGTHPGSMPPASKTIDEEGVLFEGELMIENGVFREQAMRQRLGEGALPARNPDQNIADLKAQAAACARGEAELMRMVDMFSLETVRAYMGHVQDNAEEAVRRTIQNLADGKASVFLDDGSEIRVAIRVDREARTACVDFTGSSGVSATNFNAPRAVCRAAVLYTFRTLVETPIPMNDGCLRPIELIIPEGSILSPIHPAAVVAGNVETSQCIVDALLLAVGRAAASQGTMNNFTFGDATYQYYETIAGGAGAGPGFNGASAVQTHMTNSRLTDPEVLEWRFPVLLESFSIRQGSGGAGAWRGGDGTVRRIRFLKAMDAAILSNRRALAPPGAAGGGDAKPGINRVERADGTIEVLSATAEIAVEPGDVIVIETPGGGGFGTV